MSFINVFYENLGIYSGKAMVTEVHGLRLESATGKELGEWVAAARGALRTAGIQPGDRVALLAPNSSRWAAADLAILGEGAVVVPMYARQDPEELVSMMQHCGTKLVLCGDSKLMTAVHAHWDDAPTLTFKELFKGEPIKEPVVQRQPSAPVTIIYTSGTSGEPKGVVLTVENFDYMLPKTGEAIRAMMGPVDGDDRVFHYLPFCFAGSRVVLWTCLYRGNGIFVSTNLDNLMEEIGTVSPHYFLNVPMLLERIRKGVEEKIRSQSKPIRALYDRGCHAWKRITDGDDGPLDRGVLALARRVILGRIRTKIGPDLRCLICGSAPLSAETQSWFSMLQINVYQVYGLTETTAIVTMDKPPKSVPGSVGYPLSGSDIRLGEGDELLVRGPHIFSHYWGNTGATEAIIQDGWFHTGDQAEVDAKGNWRIVGRVGNLLVPTSGHNISPEPIERQIIEGIDGVEQAVLVGHGRPFIGALITGDVDTTAVEAGLEAVNEALPHYRRVRAYHVCQEPFTVENGLLTANRKLKRKVIWSHHEEAVEGMYP